MCAINGFTWSDPDALARMQAATRHRGPDGEGTEVLPRVSLGHARLAVIDLSEDAAQPMWNRARTKCIVFNGEIYNFRELRETLPSDWTWRSESDTEVLLAVLDRDGVAGLSRLEGIFAFALWDEEKGELLLARDERGVKPLYWHAEGGRLVFSSEAKAIHEVVGSPSLDRRMLGIHLALGFTPGPRTLFEGIRRLEPGTWLKRGADGRIETGRFAERPKGEWTGTREEAAHAVRETLERAVRAQLVSDRQIGIPLSGGVDSTALAVLIAGMTDGTLRTYSTRFDFPDTKGKFSLDADIAAETAKRLGTRHTDITVTSDDMFDRIDRVVLHMDEPNWNYSASSVLRLAEEASRDVAVLFSGDGPDELFGGYPRYLNSRMVSMARRIPYAFRKVVSPVLRAAGRPVYAEKLLIDSDAGQYASFWGTSGLRSEVVVSSPDARLESHLEPYLSHGNDFENRMMAADRDAWLVDQALMQVDRLYAAVGIEGRVPYLDRDLVALAASIPSAWKLPGFLERQDRGKAVFREAVDDLLPPAVREKAKSGWTAPMAKWIRTDRGYGLVRDRLGALPAHLFDRDAAIRMLDDHRAAREYLLYPIWNLFTLSAWIDTFDVST